MSVHVLLVNGTLVRFQHTQRKSILSSLSQHLMHYLSYTKSRCLTNTLMLLALVSTIFREYHLNC